MSQTSAQPPTGPPPRPAPRRQGRGLVVLIVVLVVLAGLVVGGDQVARSVAQSAAAGRIQERLVAPARPSVEIRGFPFLTQVALGRFDEIHVTSGGGQITVYGKEIAVNNLDATAYDVVASQRYERIVAGRGDVTALLPYASVGKLTDLNIDGAGDGKIRVRFEIPFGTTQVSGTATGRPVLDPGSQQLSFTDVNVSLGNSPDIAIADAVGKVVLAPIPVASIPYGLKLTAIEVRDDGVVVSASGQDLPLRVP